jgi:hypothetical protein
MTAAEAIVLMEDHDERGVSRPLVQLVMDWNRSSDPRSLVEAAPRSANPGLLAILAAVVHALGDRDQVPLPAWVHTHIAATPITLSGVDLGTPYGQLIAASSPPVSAIHRVYFDAELLDR